MKIVANFCKVSYIFILALVKTERQAGRVLTELEAKGEIKRLTRGIYCKPTATRFGPLYPNIPKIVEAIAKRDHAQVLPSGQTAANILGLSTQVPMNYSFITSGSSRQMTLDGKTVNLQRAVPRNFVYETRLAALIVQALKSTGEENIGREELSALKTAIDSAPEKEAFRNDVSLMPIWIKTIINPLL